MNVFFNGVKSKIKKAIKTGFTLTKSEIGDEKVYAVAFVTDSDYVTLWLGINTYEHLEKKDAEYAKNGDDSTTKWDPSDWGYSVGDEQFDSISEKLSDKMDKVIDSIEKKNSDLSFEQLEEIIKDSDFAKEFIEMLTSVLHELIQSNSFGFDNDEVTYFISISDDERAVEIENNSAKVLNSKELYQEFVKRETSY